MIKCNAWTLALISVGVVSLPAVAQAEEAAKAAVSSLTPTSISGYVDTSAQWNFGTGNANLPPYAFGGPGKADGFNLNVAKLTIEKPLEPTDSWSSGYKVDLLFGPDANTLFTQSSGVAGDFGVKQAYVALRTPVGNGLDLKVGVFDCVVGYEVFDSGSNPNYTRSYGYTMEPTTHTGVLMSYQFCDFFSATFGVANTYGPTINDRAQFYGKAESYKAYTGSLALTAPEDMGFLAGSVLYAGFMSGFGRPAKEVGLENENQTLYYVGATAATPVEGLRVGAAFDLLDIHNQSGETWALGGYASYQATEKLSFHLRGEYLKDRGTQKTFTGVDANGDLYAAVPDKTLAVTATAQYDLWKNVVSRLELRWDHSLSGEDAFGGSVAGEPELKNAWMLAANIIYKF